MRFYKMYVAYTFSFLFPFGLLNFSLPAPLVLQLSLYCQFDFVSLTKNSLEVAKANENTSAAQAASYDRDSPLYPYKSHGQWLKAFYGLTASIILIIFNGVPAFLEHPFNCRKFASAYIGVCPPAPFLLNVAN